MPKLHESRFLPYSHKQLFDLVMDIESYPKFLPFCVGSRIILGLDPRTSGVESKVIPQLPETLGSSPREMGINETIGSSPREVAIKAGGNVITAELTIKASLFKESYTSLITPNFTEDEATIELMAITGPFKHLTNSWKFKPAEGGATVDFTLDFELKSLLLGRMMGGYLSEAYTKMINAFEKRAKEIYDKEKNATQRKDLRRHK